MQKPAVNRGFLGWWRRYRLSSIGLIPADTRVDPTLFPEDEFPLVCPKCEYSLRGLPSDICPECGGQFDCGRLLVEQYVIERGKRHADKPNPLARMSLITGIGILSLFYCLVWLAWLWKGQQVFVLASPEVIMGFLAAALLTKLTGLACIMFWSLTEVLRLRRCHQKVKRVSNAIDTTTLAFHKSRRTQRVLKVLWAAVCIPYVIWVFDWRFFSHHPQQTIVPLVAVFAAGLSTWLMLYKKRS